ncbi:unnamed protein product, partial [Durusdinium trenchii]
IWRAGQLRARVGRNRTRSMTPADDSVAGLVIQELKQDSAAILRWNRDHPELQLMKGQAILEVNGCIRSSEMMEHLRHSKTLEMRVSFQLTPALQMVSQVAERKQRTQEAVEAKLDEVHCA